MNLAAEAKSFANHDLEHGNFRSPLPMAASHPLPTCPNFSPR